MVRFVPTQLDVYRSLLATGAVLFKRGDFRVKACHLDEKRDGAEAEFETLDAKRAHLPVRAALSRMVATGSLATASRRRTKSELLPMPDRWVTYRLLRTATPTRFPSHCRCVASQFLSTRGRSHITRRSNGEITSAGPVHTTLCVSINETNRSPAGISCGLSMPERAACGTRQTSDLLSGKASMTVTVP